MRLSPSLLNTTCKDIVSIHERLITTRGSLRDCDIISSTFPKVLFAALDKQTLPNATFALDVSATYPDFYQKISELECVSARGNFY